jgi:glycosyltransferase involved in cell wall biosynthesis
LATLLLGFQRHPIPSELSGELFGKLWKASVVRQGNSIQLRVLHLVSSKGVAGTLQATLFMPLLSKAPRQHVATEVVCLAPDAVPAAVLRQKGIPVHELPLCRQRFSLTSFLQLAALAREFDPEVIHAWGYTAQVVAGWLRKRCNSPRLVITASGTVPVAPRAGFLDHRKLKAAARAAAKADRVVYSSEAAAAAHRRCGFPEQGYTVIAPGLDASRFRPDAVTRRKVREQLAVPPNAFVVGMMAPCLAESDHVTLLKGISELVKTQPNIYLLLAGHGVQKGNAQLMTQIGSGNLATRTQLLGEWSDHAGFFNACDAAVSSALTDTARMNLVMAMLCAVPCVATGVGEQGEVIGQCSVAIEPSSPAAIVRGVTRVIEMPAERRTFLAHSSRKHALKNFVQFRALQLYLQLYGELLDRPMNIEELIPTLVEPELPLSAPPVPASAPTPVPAVLGNIEPPAEHESLEARAKEVIEWQPTALPAAADPAAAEQPVSDGDVLAIFESAMVPREVPAAAAVRPKVDEAEDLLAPELLAVNAGEEFRPRQVTVGASIAKTKPAASVAAMAGKEPPSASVRPLRGAVAPKSATAEERPSVPPEAPASRTHAAPASNTSDLDETLQLDVLTGELLDKQ